MKQAEAGRDVGMSSTEQDRMFSLRNDVLHLILLPTEQCNFRCTYCYEDFSGANEARDHPRGQADDQQPPW